MTVERYPRSARRYHTAVYAVTLLLLATGWWLLAGREGDPSPIARLTGIPDARLHVWFGWALVAVALAPLVFAVRGVVAFARETFRYDRGDLRWLARFPRGALTGRFTRHEGHFDPGQRIANVVIVGLLLTLVVSGVALVFIHVGPAFVVVSAIHRLATIAFTVLIVGHIVVALGILPGYRGVWRSMHLGGRVPLATARRLWPGWTERRLGVVAGAGGSDRDPSVEPPRVQAAAERAGGPAGRSEPGAQPAALHQGVQSAAQHAGAKRPLTRAAGQLAEEGQPQGPPAQLRRRSTR